MTDLNKERELYESVIEKTQDLKMVHLVGISFNEEKNQYEVPGEKWASELTDACLELNTGWFIWQECVKAKAQAVPEGFKIVPIELSEEIAERLALERVQKPRPENDPVWVEIAERAYKSNLLAKKWELVREYKILTEASESGAEG